MERHYQYNDAARSHNGTGLRQPTNTTAFSSPAPTGTTGASTGIRNRGQQQERRAAAPWRAFHNEHGEKILYHVDGLKVAIWCCLPEGGDQQQQEQEEGEERRGRRRRRREGFPPSPTTTAAAPLTGINDSKGVVNSVDASQHPHHQLPPSSVVDKEAKDWLSSLSSYRQQHPPAAGRRHDEATITSNNALLSVSNKKCVVYCYDRGVVLETIRPNDIASVYSEDVAAAAAHRGESQPTNSPTRKRSGYITATTGTGPYEVSITAVDKRNSDVFPHRQIPVPAGVQPAASITLSSERTWAMVCLSVMSARECDELMNAFGALKARYLHVPSKTAKVDAMERALVLQNEARILLAAHGVQPDLGPLPLSQQPQSSAPSAPHSSKQLQLDPGASDDDDSTGGSLSSALMSTTDDDGSDSDQRRVDIDMVLMSSSGEDDVGEEEMQTRRGGKGKGKKNNPPAAGVSPLASHNRWNKKYLPLPVGGAGGVITTISNDNVESSRRGVLPFQQYSYSPAVFSTTLSPAPGDQLPVGGTNGGTATPHPAGLQAGVAVTAPSSSARMKRCPWCEVECEANHVQRCGLREFVCPLCVEEQQQRRTAGQGGQGQGRVPPSGAMIKACDWEKHQALFHAGGTAVVQPMAVEAAGFSPPAPSTSLSVPPPLSPSSSLLHTQTHAHTHAPTGASVPHSPPVAPANNVPVPQQQQKEEQGERSPVLPPASKAVSGVPITDGGTTPAVVVQSPRGSTHHHRAAGDAAEGKSAAVPFDSSNALPGTNAVAVRSGPPDTNSSSPIAKAGPKTANPKQSTATLERAATSTTSAVKRTSSPPRLRSLAAAGIVDQKQKQPPHTQPEGHPPASTMTATKKKAKGNAPTEQHPVPVSSAAVAHDAHLGAGTGAAPNMVLSDVEEVQSVGGSSSNRTTPVISPLPSDSGVVNSSDSQHPSRSRPYPHQHQDPTIELGSGVPLTRGGERPTPSAKESMQSIPAATAADEVGGRNSDSSWKKCMWCGELQPSSHVDDCDYRRIQCRFCGQKLRRMDRRGHTAQCTARKEMLRKKNEAQQQS